MQRGGRGVDERGRGRGCGPVQRGGRVLLSVVEVMDVALCNVVVAVLLSVVEVGDEAVCNVVVVLLASVVEVMDEAV